MLYGLKQQTSLYNPLKGTTCKQNKLRGGRVYQLCNYYVIIKKIMSKSKAKKLMYKTKNQLQN